MAAHTEYKSWKRVSDQAHWAPFLCGSPPPAGTQLSDAAPGSPHGRKLYFLFAKDESAYFRTADLELERNYQIRQPAQEVFQPVGQVIVKEAFIPEHATLAEASDSLSAADRQEGRPLPSDFVSSDEGLFRMGRPAGIFAMLKVDPETPGSDHGWVYATVSPRGVITSVGAIESCVDCHIKAPNDRLFGPVWTREARPRAPRPR